VSPERNPEPPGREDARTSTASYAAGVYGTIVSASVLAAASVDTTRSVIILLVGTLLVYWVAEQYARTLAHSLAGRRPDPAAVRAGLREGLPMIQASYIPVAVLVIARVAGLSTGTAVNVALAACIAVLCTLGWLGGRRQRLLLRGRLVSTLVAGSLGVVMALLKFAVLH